MKEVYNPYLPSYEYIPDAEPHIFGDRVYIYGSHDRFNGRFFCMNDYVCYSAPIDDLSSWRYEGVIWRKKDDRGKTPLILKSLYAPDVVEGNDGFYYLYYFKGNSQIIGVARCKTPAGKYEYYGHVRFPDGTLLGKEKGNKDLAQFDPGVFKDDDGKIYLYTGFGEKSPNIFTSFGPVNYNGSMGVELEEDMLTIKPETMARIAKTQHCSKGTGYEGHEFFEASSMRKFNDKYYFIYSSVLGHELCYAIGNSPLGKFEYGGTLVSIGDVGLSEKPLNYLGNTHGSLIKIKDSYYVFYHRQTNRHCHSRQACAEKIEMDKSGHFKQAELTSCGLNGGPLSAKGIKPAYIACHLFSKKGVVFYRAKNRSKIHPYFTQSGKDRESDPDQYIANFNDGCTAGFKYLDFKGDESSLAVQIAGNARGKLYASNSIGGDPIARIEINAAKEKKWFEAKLDSIIGAKPLYFRYEGEGHFDFFSFEIR